jgi:hypothetical protein
MADMKIEGIEIKKDIDSGLYVCYVSEFTDDLQNRIKNLLSSIWHGAVSAEENQEIYNYSETLKDFLERYDAQSTNTRKGIIGELLAHLLIGNYIPKLDVVSIMKNKEEKSIKKGFDLVYCNNRDKQIWYCEVKSGGDVDNLKVDDKNNERLNAAKSSIKEMFQSDRCTLWQSVLNDVNLTIFNSKKRIDISKLLKKDYPGVENRNLDRCVILTSVIYKKLENKVCMDKIKEYKTRVDSENIFAGLIVFSIQKPTYTKIVTFLKEESAKKDG